MNLNCNIESVPVEDIAETLIDYDEDLILQLIEEQKQWSPTLCSKLKDILQQRTAQISF